MEYGSTEFYSSPFCSRYATKEMLRIFSPEKKYKTWRKLWVALAKAEKAAGLNISDEQIEELTTHIDNINYETANKYEKEIKHDVMAHIKAYGQQCKKSAGIIHLGATSCYVTDNADIIIMKEGLELIRKDLLSVAFLLSNFADRYKSLPCLAYTHLQPAQLTTVGKRATIWLNEICMDIEQLNATIENLKLLGSKGTTGTQASFLKLFEGDFNKVLEVEKRIVQEMGFKEACPVSGQTYSRKTDFYISSILASIAQTAMKFANDIRLLQSFKEIEEPFEKKQVGSSAMPYKRNPMKSERITAIARYVIVNILNPAFTAGTQWLERSLDDSANKRIVMPEMFLATNSILNIMINICSNIVVNENIIKQRVLKHLPFMATENIMMAAVKKGKSRQKIHEKLRIHSILAAETEKENGKENDLINRICGDDEFDLSSEDFKNVLKPEKFIGMSSYQVDCFLKEIVKPLIGKFEFNLKTKFDLLV